MKSNKKNILLFHLFVSYVLFISLLILIGSGLGRLESYLAVLFSATLSILYLAYKFNRLFEINIMISAIVGFSVKLLIGYMFWEFYMWPDYFSSQNTSIAFDHYEYLYTHNNIEKIAEYRIDNGFFTILPIEYLLEQGKYLFINYILSNLYMSGNSNLLDFSVQNTLFSFYTAVIISLIAMGFGTTKSQTKVVFIISLFQPFSFISTMIWRDVVGQFFVMFGVYLLLLSFNSRMIKSIVILATSSLSMALLRSVYVFIPVLLYALMYFKGGMASFKRSSIFLALIVLVAFAIYETNLIVFVETGYSSYLSNVNIITLILSLPIDYVRSLIGPFPWINWFEFNDNTIFLLGNYLQAVYVLVIIYFTAKYYKSCASDFKFYIVLFCFILLTMSLVISDTHSEYFTFAAALMLPISAKYLTIRRFIFSYYMVFTGFIMLNIIYVSLGLHGAGLGVNL